MAMWSGLALTLLTCLWPTEAVRSTSVVWTGGALDTDVAPETGEYFLRRPWRYGGVLKVSATFVDDVHKALLDDTQNLGPAQIVLYSDGDPVVDYLFPLPGPHKVIDGPKRRSKVVQRSNFDVFEEWGSLIVPTIGAQVVMEIERTHRGWEFSMDGERMPWLDFLPGTSNLINKVRIFGGLAHVTASLVYRECLTPCIPSECNECWVNGEKADASQCRTVNQGEAGKCEIPVSAEEQCCQGRGHEMDWNLIKDREWVSIRTDDDTLVFKTCEAFLGNGSLCTDLAGSNVKVVSKDNAARTIEAWVPTFPTEKNPVYFPAFILRPRDLQLRSYLVPAGAGPDLFVNMDNQYLHEVRGMAVAAHIPAPMYVNRINNHPWTRARYLEARDSGRSFRLTLTETQEPFGACTDTVGWVDRKKKSCSEYASGHWCTKEGLPGAGLKKKNKRNPTKPLYDLANRDSGESALEACCVCGGGHGATITTTTSTTTGKPVLLTTSILPTVSPDPLSDLRQEIYVSNALDQYPLYMGLFKLNPYRQPPSDAVLPGIYENVQNKILYYTQGRWVLGDDFSTMVLLSDDNASYGEDPADVIPGEWVNEEETVIALTNPEVEKCGATTDCHCPQPFFTCKASANNQICDPTAVEKVACGSVDGCCHRLPVCVNFEVRCGLRHVKANDAICPATGCTEGVCCQPLCVSIDCQSLGFGEPKESELATVCPFEGCDPTVCCKSLEGTDPTSPVTPPTDFVECDECLADGSVQQSAVAFEVTVKGLNPSAMVQNFEVRADFITAVEGAVKGLTADMAESRCLVQIKDLQPSDATMLVLLMPSSDKLRLVEEEMRELVTTRQNLVTVQIEEAIAEVQDVNLITNDGTVDVADVAQVKAVTILPAARQADSVKGDIGSIWWSHATAALTGMTEFFTAYWWILVPVGVAAIGLTGYGVYWFSLDTEDERDVLG